MFANIINKIKSNFRISWVIYIFLGVVAFNFANNIIVFASVSILANALFLIFSKRKINSEFLLTLFLCVIPLISLGLFSVISKFNLDGDSNYSTVKYVFLILSFCSVPFLGFQSRGYEKFNIKIAIKVIYILLAFWMLINFLITIIQFGPFYTFIYYDKYFFDYGYFGRLPISKIAYMLLGFKVERITIELFTVVAGVLSSALLGLFFVSYKEDKNSFLTYLVTGSIGLLSLLLTLNKSSVICYVTLIIAFTLIVLFAKKIIPFNKITKITILSIASLIIIYFLLVMFGAFKIFNIEENTFFVNKLTRKYYLFVRTMSEYRTYNGFNGFLIGNDKFNFTVSWMFELLAVSTVFGWLSFIVFIVLIFVRYAKYIKESNDDICSKMLLVSIVLGFLLITGTCYNSMPYYEKTLYVPLFYLSPFIIILFIYGYIGKNEEEIRA